MQLLTSSAIARIKIYLKENWGAPFIITFMMLLVVAAVSLSLSWSYLADTLAVYAFYALVVGVALQLVCFLKYSKKSNDEASV